MKLLVIVYELLAEYLRKGLSEEGYTVDVAHNGIDGLHLATEVDYTCLCWTACCPASTDLPSLPRCDRANRRLC